MFRRPFGLWHKDLTHQSVGLFPTLQVIGDRIEDWHRGCFLSFRMKIRAISRGKLKLLLTVFCAVILASGDDAKAIGYPLPPFDLASWDQHELGQIWPETLTDHADRQQYVNLMIGLPLGGSEQVIVNGQSSLLTRSNNDFGPLPGAAKLVLTGEGTTVNLGTQGTYNYLVATYGGPNGVSQVWHVSDLTGIVIIPGVWAKDGLPSWALFGASPQGIPDGGATVMLLGVALAALGLVRRWLPIKR